MQLAYIQYEALSIEEIGITIIHKHSDRTVSFFFIKRIEKIINSTMSSYSFADLSRALKSSSLNSFNFSRLNLLFSLAVTLRGNGSHHYMLSIDFKST